MEEMVLICFKEPAVTLLVTSDLDTVVKGVKDRGIRVKDADGRPMVVFQSRRCNVCYARKASEDEVKAYREMKARQKEEILKKMSEAPPDNKRIQPAHIFPGRKRRRDQ